MQVYMGKINLHAHTSYSDGVGSLKDMVLIAKGHGHVCFVSSDHDYMMSLKTYCDQLKEAQEISGLYGIKVFCGLEISLYHEEAVLIGENACRSWMSIYHSIREGKADVRVSHLKEIISEHESGLCLVHPCLRGPAEFYSMFDAYEIGNAGSIWPDDMIQKMETLMPGKRQVKGSDAHSTNWYDTQLGVCNDTDQTFSTEGDIIKWLKSV